MNIQSDHLNVFADSLLFHNHSFVDIFSATLAE